MYYNVADSVPCKTTSFPMLSLHNSAEQILPSLPVIHGEGPIPPLTTSKFVSVQYDASGPANFRGSNIAFNMQALVHFAVRKPKVSVGDSLDIYYY